jgi:hypothetical protein
MRSITLGLPDQVAEQLAELAERDFRRPRDQAAILLIGAIARAAKAAPDARERAALKAEPRR